MICRKTMTRCLTPGMCSPHGGCQDPVVAELRAVNFDYQLGADAASTEIARLKAEIDRLRLAEGDAMTYKAGMENVAQQRDQLKAENEALRKALLEASEEIETWGAYASPYFQEKYDLSGCVEKFHAAAMGKGE
ncbi:hypothetical protein D3C75_697400 [compost metagenome]